MKGFRCDRSGCGTWYDDKGGMRVQARSNDSKDPNHPPNFDLCPKCRAEFYSKFMKIPDPEQQP